MHACTHRIPVHVCMHIFIHLSLRVYVSTNAITHTCGVMTSWDIIPWHREDLQETVLWARKHILHTREFILHCWLDHRLIGRSSPKQIIRRPWINDQAFYYGRFHPSMIVSNFSWIASTTHYTDLFHWYEMRISMNQLTIIHVLPIEYPKYGGFLKSRYPQTIHYWPSLAIQHPFLGGPNWISSISSNWKFQLSINWNIVSVLGPAPDKVQEVVQRSKHSHNHLGDPGP